MSDIFAFILLLINVWIFHVVLLDLREKCLVLVTRKDRFLNYLQTVMITQLKLVFYMTSFTYLAVFMSILELTEMIMLQLTGSILYKVHV